MGRIIVLFFLLLPSFGHTQTFFEKDFVGTYGDTTCFRSSECCVSKLKIKVNHTYVLVMTGHNHGHKNKSTYTGTWKIESNTITLTPDKTKRNLRDEIEVVTYLLYQNTLVCENEGKFDVENIAYRKNKK